MSGIKKIWAIMHERITNRKRCQFGRFSYTLGCNFEGNNLIASNTVLRNSYLGYGSYVGKKSELNGAKIGRYTCIGPRVLNITGKHPTRDFVSVHPAFFSVQHEIGFSYVNKEKYEELAFVDADEKVNIEIGNDVWIGASVTIIDGVKIGDGAIIAAGAIVTKDIEPYTIVGGIPAKEIRKRFDDEDIKFLLQYKWWEKDEEWVKNHADSFENIKRFRREVI